MVVSKSQDVLFPWRMRWKIKEISLFLSFPHSFLTQLKGFHIWKHVSLFFHFPIPFGNSWRNFTSGNMKQSHDVSGAETFFALYKTLLLHNNTILLQIQDWGIKKSFISHPHLTWDQGAGKNSGTMVKLGPCACWTESTNLVPLRLPCLHEKKIISKIKISKTSSVFNSKAKVAIIYLHLPDAVDFWERVPACLILFPVQPWTSRLSALPCTGPEEVYEYIKKQDIY